MNSPRGTMNFPRGTRVVTTDTPEMGRYAGERGTVIGDNALVFVVMDNPDLHDRSVGGKRCAAFSHDQVLEDAFFIQEEVELHDLS